MKPILLITLLMTASCSDMVTVCYNCQKFSRDKPIPSSVTPLKMIAGAPALPSQARNIYYDEECGIDCLQTFRFDLPADTAEQLMQDQTGSPSRDLTPQELTDLVSAAPSKRAWWYVAGAVTAKGASARSDGGAAFTYVLAPNGNTTTVYLTNHSF